MYRIINLSCGYAVSHFHSLVVSGNFLIYRVIRPEAHGKDYGITGDFLLAVFLLDNNTVRFYFQQPGIDL